MYTSYENTSLVKIITLLKSHKSEYLSGQDLSDSLKLSRAAVWKHIKKLQNLGYKIDSKPKLGYKLIKATELLLPWEIIDGLKTKMIGKKIYYFHTINSTQSFAIDLASKKSESGTLVISEKQTHGKGRLGRQWISPSGGIWLSLVLHPEIEISFSTLFPMITSLALAIAIEQVLKIMPRLKWPNDVTLNGKKVGGILVDAAIESGKIDYLVIGVGINFKIKSKEIEKKIKNSNNYGVTTLLKQNENTNPVKLVQRFLFEFERLYQIFQKNDIKFLISQWSRRSSTIGKSVVVSLPNKTIIGKALRIEDNGTLVISNKGKTHRIISGDVTYS